MASKASNVASILVVAIAGVAVGGLTISALTSPEGGMPDGHAHGPDTHTHDADGEIVDGENNPSPTFPDYPDVEPVMEPLVGTDGEPIVEPGGQFPVVIDTAGLAAAEEEWVEAGGDLATDPPPTVGDDEWFKQPTNHPLDPRWYKAVDGSSPLTE